MPWLWAILAVLVAMVVAGQVAYLRATAGLKGSGVARVIRAANIALLAIALGIAAYAVFAAAGRGGM